MGSLGEVVCLLGWPKLSGDCRRYRKTTQTAIITVHDKSPNSTNAASYLGHSPSPGLAGVKIMATKKMGSYKIWL